MSIVPTAYYSITASWLHWLTAVPVMGCVGCVLKSQQVPKEEKGDWMFRHKSLGLLSAMIITPRILYRVGSASSAYYVNEIMGTNTLEQIAAKASHYFLYGFLTIMPISGIAMGVYGGKGLPFFFTTIPGFEKPNGKLAKQSYDIHKLIGTYGKFLIPLHVSASFLHYFRGHTIFSRINPFRISRA